MFADVREALSKGALVFGQLETTVTARGARAPHAKLAMRTPPETARAIADAGFHVMSFAGNHCMDWSAEGLTDTIDHMTAAGVRLVGAGADLAEARRPVHARCGDALVAFLAYSSILPEGYWAEARRPGCAPLRAHTLYEMLEPDQPGTPPRILTMTHAADLAALKQDVAAARQNADIVVVSFHWGVHMTPVVIADYQREAAHAAIEAGADLILGHHPHILKGVEFHRGAAIFYSMGNFAIEQPKAFDDEITKSASFRHLLSLHPGAAPEGLYVLPEDTRKTLIVQATIRGAAIAELDVIPCWIDDTSTPHVLGAEDPRYAAVCDYVAEISAAAGFALSCEKRRDGLRLALA